MKEISKYIYNYVRTHNLIEEIQYTRPSISWYFNNLDEKTLQKGICGAEIGVHFAENAYNISTLIPIKKLYLVDPYIIYNEDPFYYEDGVYIGPDQAYDIAKVNMSVFRNIVEFIKKKSEDAIDEVPDNLDFIYIDGNHSEIKKDINLWYQKIKNGGMLSGHDFSLKEKSVAKEVIRFVEKNNIKSYYSKESDWWLIKEDDIL